MRREVFFLKDPNRNVDFRQERILELSRQLTKADGTDAAELNRELAREHLFMTIALYSRGDELQSLRPWFFKMMAHLSQTRILGGDAPDLAKVEKYHVAMWMISLGILLGYAGNTIGQIARDLDAVGKDGILDHLLKPYVSGLEPTETLLHAHPCEDLWRATQGDADKSAVWVQSYLRNTYDTQFTCSWYDTHIKHEPQFFGYWSFEVAALAKLSHWPDQPYQENLFYPRDLIHDKLFRTWLDSQEGEEDRATVKADGDKARLASNLEALLRERLQGGDAEEVDPEKLFQKMTGMSPEEYAEDPEKMQSVLVNTLRSVLVATKDLEKTAKGEVGELKGLVDGLKEMEKEWAAAGFDSGPKAMPATAEDLTAPYEEVAGGIENVLQQEGQDQEKFLTGLSELMEQFSQFFTTVDDGARTDRIASEMNDYLKEQRKDRDINNFDWGSLVPKPKDDA